MHVVLVGVNSPPLMRVSDQLYIALYVYVFNHLFFPLLFLGLKMSAVTKILILFSLFSTAQSGPFTYIACTVSCGAAYAACVAAAGGITAGTGVPAAVLACEAVYANCMAACVAVGIVVPAP